MAYINGCVIGLERTSDGLRMECGLDLCEFELRGLTNGFFLDTRWITAFSFIDGRGCCYVFWVVSMFERILMDS